MLRYYENTRYHKGIKIAEITWLKDKDYNACRWYIDYPNELDNYAKDVDSDIYAKIKFFQNNGIENFNVHKFY